MVEVIEGVAAGAGRRGVVWREVGVRAAGPVAILVFALGLCAPVLNGQVPVASDTLALWAPWSELPHQPIKNTTIADSALLGLSWQTYERQSIADGEWPLWDPNTFGGFPFAANAQNR